MRTRLWPLNRLLILAFVALTVVAAIPVAAFNALETRSLLHELTATRLEVRAAQTATSIDEHIRGIELWAHEFERRPATRRLLAAADPAFPGRHALEEETLDFVRQAERLAGILIAREDGVRLAGTGRLDVPPDLAAWPPFRRAAAGEVLVWARDAGGHHPQLLVLVPFQAPGQRQAVMIVADDLRRIEELGRDDAQDLGGGAHASLVVRDGQRLFYVGGDLGDEAERESVRVPLTMAPWTYVISLPLERFEAAGQRQLLRALAGSVGALLLALAFAPLLARRLAQPFEELEAALAAWGRGERGVRTRSMATAEAARLSAAFNRMTEELEAYEKSLQDKVAERTAALEAAHRELELFTYSASHDLRAPLRAIDGFTSALLEDEPLTPDGREMLERTAGAVERMGRLIDGLLEFGRVARHPLVRERVDVTALAREVGAELLAEAPGRDVRLTVADGLVAIADPHLLRRVLENLIGNACKYTKNKAIARIEVGETAESPPALFVRDNGAGFDMRHVGRLFTPFTRLHAASDFPGTGIGLATVRRIVERHGGEIRAVAEPDRGATFYFTLPRPRGLD